MDVSKCAIAMMGFDINKKITIHIEHHEDRRYRH